MYRTVTRHPKEPANMATATSLIRGEAIRNENVTPSGMPPFTNPMNRGMDEHEQNGVTAPNTAARKYSMP